MLITILFASVITSTQSTRSHVTNWLKSKPNDMVACEAECMNLMCDHYEGIRIIDAFWGRDNDIDCQVDNPLFSQSDKEHCYALDKNYAFRKVEEECQNKPECEISASKFGFDLTICPHVKKFFRVKYECRQLDGSKR